LNLSRVYRGALERHDITVITPKDPTTRHTPNMWSSALKSFQSNINSNYKISDAPSSTAGPWRIFDAKNKSTGKAASVFVFDRKSLEPQSGGLGGRSSAQALKKAQDDVVERLKREAASLARLRHPSILELAEPVEDTRSGGLQFATEPVTASLAGLLREKDEQEQAGGPGGRRSRYVVHDPDSGGKKRRDIEIDELEIQKGLLQVGKGLEFLHESAGLVHANLTPDAIMVNAKGDWKISGLGFSGKSEGTTVATSAPYIALSETLNFDPRLPRTVQLNLDYCSPDLVIDNNVSSAADMFSLGLLLVALYNSPHQSPLEANMSVSAYKRLFASSSTIPSQSNNFISSAPLPRPVSNLLPRLITRRPAQRMSAREFQQAEYFDNILVSTIRFLESLPAKTPNEKSQFLRGLPRIINQFPKTVLEKKVLPALLDEMKDRELISLILQNVFKMIKIMPAGRRAFGEKVVPKLREVFLTASAADKKKDAGQAERDGVKEAGLMVLLENMQVIAENTNGKEFKDDIWPIIQLSMESPTHSVVDASLGTLSVILSVLDFSSVKNDVFPVIATVFSKTSSLGIKIRGLEALQVLCGGTPGSDSSGGSDGLDGFDPEEQNKKKQQSVILDKYTIQEKVVPLLKAIKTKEPAVMVSHAMWLHWTFR
jgi:SCY1-like protein 2